MVKRPVLQAAIAAAAVIWGVLLTVQGVAVDLEWLRWYSVVVGAVMVLLIAFDKFLWRLSPISVFIRIPNASGTWKGVLRSSWVNPTTGEGIAPITVFLVVRQTFSTVKVCLLTQESSSFSIAAEVKPLNEGDSAALSYTYSNTPKLRLQERSRIHHGSAFLEVHGRPPDLISGSYWTDRDTKGEMEFRSRTKKRHTEFGKAMATFDEAAKRAK